MKKNEYNFRKKKDRKPQKYGTHTRIERTPEVTNDKEGEDDQTEDTK